MVVMAKRKSIGIPGLGERLRKYREAQNLTAAMLATETQEIFPDTTISRQVIFNIENGRKTDVNVTELVQLARALDVPPSALLCDFDKPFEEPTEGPFKMYDAVSVLDLFSAKEKYPDYSKNTSNTALRKDLSILYKCIELRTLAIGLLYDYEQWEETVGKQLHPSALNGLYSAQKEKVRDLIINNHQLVTAKIKSDLEKSRRMAEELKLKGIELPRDVTNILDETSGLSTALEAEMQYRLKDAGLDSEA